MGGKEEGWEKLLTVIAAEPAGGREGMGAAGAASSLVERKSPREALKWADSLPGDGRRLAAYEGAYGAWARLDGEAAMASALALPAGPERTEALVAVGVIKGARFPAETLVWSRGLGGVERARLLTALTDSLLPRQADETRAEVGKVLAVYPAAGEDAAFREAVARMIPGDCGYNATETRKTLDWVDSLPASAMKRNLVALVSEKQGIAPEIKAWLEKLPAGERPEQE